ncbi:MAG: glycosyltransferase, partial [Deltaproteobacteria bacterium]|nr:glycosyltransferase [Deltaproteobacteria bacterium]
MKDDDKIMKNCTFSIIIPVLRESDKVNALIEHLYNQQTDEDYEIIIVEGSQTRETMSVVQHREIIV